MHNFSTYLTFSDDDLKWQIVCNDAGYTKILPNQKYPPFADQHPEGFKSVIKGRTLNEYQLIYITDGSGMFYSGENTYTIQPGSVMLLFPGIKHAYHPNKDTGWTEYWIGFSGPYPDKLRNLKVLEPEKCHFRLGLHDSILNLFNKIFDQLQGQNPGFQIRSGADTISLLAEIFSYIKISDVKSGDKVIVEKIKFLFEEHLYGTIDLQTLSNELGYSKSKIISIFKAYSGLSPYQYFLNMKVNKAKEWLENDAFSVKEISLNLSFSDPLYFTRLFKKKTGFAPTKWRIYH